MLKQKTTIAKKQTLLLLGVVTLSLLALWIMIPRIGSTHGLSQPNTQIKSLSSSSKSKSKLTKELSSPRKIIKTSQSGPETVITTTVAPDSISGSTFQSHNQKVVSNSYGIFMTHVQTQRYCTGDQSRCCNANDSEAVDDFKDYLVANNLEPDKTKFDLAKYFLATWRLSRSIDGGATFTTVYENKHYTPPPAIETDSQGNLYLAHIAYTQNGHKSYLMRFLASNNFQNPTTTLLGISGAKYAMEIDEVRGQLYFFSNSNIFSIIRLSDLTIVSQYQLTKDGTNANMHYPHLYLDDYANLYVAWTSVLLDYDHYTPPKPAYWSIHFMRSLDGGITWKKPNGQTLTPPIVADDTGPTDEITTSDEHTVNTWLSSFLVKGDKVHFLYNAGFQPDRQYYVRYDLAISYIDRKVSPFMGNNLSIANLDGIFATQRSIKEIYCVSKSNRGNSDSRFVVLKSEDNGNTWQDHALGPISPTYAVGGSPQVTNDGYIIGSYTESSNFSNPYVPTLIKFFKIPSLAEPSKKDLVFTAGDLELTGSGKDHDEFSGGATAHSPTYVVGQSGLNQMRNYIGYSYGDPNGGNKAQFLQFNNLVIGKQYTFYVQPSSKSGDGHCFYATPVSGAVVFEGTCKGIGDNPINKISDAWKIVFNATDTSATIRIGNYWDSSNSGGVSRFIYIDSIYSMIGDLELSGNQHIDTDEFTGGAREHSPTYIFGQGNPSYVRNYLGFSYGDPAGGTKAQHLQLTNLTIGKNYTLNVYPSGNYGDGNCYYAVPISGGTVVSGVCMGWASGQFQSISQVWKIVVRADSQTMTLKLFNNRDASNSDGVSRYLYIDAIGVQEN